METVPRKSCTRCGVVKPLSDYRKAAKEKDGYQACCRDCMREKWTGGLYTRPESARLAAHAAAWRARHPDKLRQVAREFRKKNAAKLNAKGRRLAAQKRALSTVPFTKDQLAARLSYWANRCWMCGQPATGIDHVKPTARGGANILANIRPACGPCNSRKCDQWPFPLVRNIPRWG